MDKSQSVSTRLRGECTRYYNRRLLPYTRKRLAAAAGQAAQAQAQSSGTEQRVVQQQQHQQPDTEDPMDIVTFTSSVENVLSAYLNRHRNIEYKTGLVQLVAPVRSFVPQTIARILKLSYA